MILVSRIGSQHQTALWDRQCMEKKEQAFQARGGRISGYYWKPDPPTFFLNGRAIRDIRLLRKNITFTAGFASTYGICRGMYWKTRVTSCFLFDLLCLP